MVCANFSDITFYKKGTSMDFLRWAVIFLVVALVAGVLGFGGVFNISVDMAKVLFAIFIVLFVISLIFGYRGRNP